MTASTFRWTGTALLVDGQVLPIKGLRPPAQGNPLAVFVSGVPEGIELVRATLLAHERFVTDSFCKVDAAGFFSANFPASGLDADAFEALAVRIDFCGDYVAALPLDVTACVRCGCVVHRMFTDEHTRVCRGRRS